MGTIVVHAGRPKSGSTSIQAFLAGHATALRAEGVDVVVPAPATAGGDRLVLAPVVTPDGGAAPPALANGGSLHWRLQAADDPAPLLADLVDQLDRRARQHDVVVLSGEALSLAVAGGDPGLLGALDELARRHRVRLAYYVRPQHAELEAQWCQAWRMDLGAEQATPADFVRLRASWLHHDRTRDLVAELAPGVELVLRPLLPTVLADGDAVVDLAATFLGSAGQRLVADAPPGRRWNPSLPLDLVNALRVELPGRFRPSPEHDADARRLRRAGWWRDLPPSPDAVRSRAVLQRWCRAELEPGNQRCIAAEGWPVADLVPPVPSDAPGGADLAELDELWCPAPSPRTAELAAAALACIDGG